MGYFPKKPHFYQKPTTEVPLDENHRWEAIGYQGMFALSFQLEVKPRTSVLEGQRSIGQAGGKLAVWLGVRNTWMGGFALANLMFGF